MKMIAVIMDGQLNSFRKWPINTQDTNSNSMSLVIEICLEKHTSGMTPISSKRGPRMNPPPEPSRPPTVPPNMPHNAQNARFGAVHSIEASHTDSKFPAFFLSRHSL